MSYYTKITTAGLAAITAAMNNSSKVPITYMAFGDGNGLIPEPDENATSLVNEVYRVGVNKVEVHSKNPNWLVCEAIIPSAVGGFNIREVALYDNTGTTMLAIANYPPTYKPTLEEGSAKIQTIRIILQVNNSGNFELIVDPDVVLATIDYVDKKLSSSMTVVNKYEDLERIANPIHNMIVNVFGKGSYKFDSISRLWIPEKHIDNLFVFIDDIVSSNDGSLDCSSEINQTIQKLKGRHVTLLGNPNSIYRLDSTLELIGVNDITLDFRWATILDNVQGTIASSGGRGKHTFCIYDSHNIILKNINYNVMETRVNTSTSSIPTICFWIGGQYLGGELTTNVLIENFTADGHSIDQGMVVSGVGELDGIKLQCFNIKNGNWMFGCNFEYGLQPQDLNSNLSLNNGRHPYNIEVIKFDGENLRKCIGFLRVASCYNAKFSLCSGFNVPNFIYFYSGDRGISRYSQNVIFELCKSKFDDSINVANYTVSIIVTTKDGSTGEVLPEWTNRNHQIKFTMCEFIGNYTKNNAGIRFIGNAGKTIFENCLVQRFYFGAWIQWLNTSNPAKDSPYSLSFRDCLFNKNKSDIRQIDVSGVLYDHCSFKNKVNDPETPYQVGVWKLSGHCSGTTFRHCLFAEQTANAYFMRIESEDVYLDNNNFQLYDYNGTAITSTVPIYGRLNITNGKLTGNEETVNRIIGDELKVKVYSDISNTNSIDFNSSSIWLINNTQTLEKIKNGKVGDVVEFRGGAITGEITFIHNAENSTTSTRLINKSGANDINSGLTTSRRYMKFGDGWREM